MNLAYIGLGSNLSNPAEQIKSAAVALNNIEKSAIVQSSSLYFSRPMGPQDQPDYMNAVIALTTELTPLALLDALQTIENKAGRIRKDNRWGARILDLDILLFGNQIINNKRLTIPHYGMKSREFVLTPLLQISPHLILPCGESLNKLAQQLDQNGLEVYAVDLTN